MATVQLFVPDAAIPELGEVLAARMGVSPPDTNALRVDLFRQWVRVESISLIRNLRLQKAKVAEQEKPPDEALNWSGGE